MDGSEVDAIHIGIVGNYEVAAIVPEGLDNSERDRAVGKGNPVVSRGDATYVGDAGRFSQDSLQSEYWVEGVRELEAAQSSVFAM